jgi:hypothetical protein
MKALFLLVAGLTAASPLFGAITANIAATRTSGVAPLAVHFDASATTSTTTTRPFHDCHYEWNYGDPSSGVWATNGKSKNRDVSPMGGHVFETPGEYTVTLTAKDSSGATDTKTVVITVDDPDEVFAGTKTICISTTSDFTGAPTGALQVTTTAWATIASHLGTGKRVLLKRGQAWALSSTTQNMTFAGPGILGAFGSGARPILRFTSGNDGNAFALGSSQAPGQFNDFRFMDLDIDGAGYARRFIIGNGTVNNITILRIRMNRGSNFISISASTLDYNNRNGNPGHVLHSGMAVVETEYERLISGQGSNIGMLIGQKTLFLGNRWNDATGGEHVLRIPAIKRALLAHNRLSNAAPTKHLIKLHAPSAGASYVTSAERKSNLFVIADNYFSSEQNDWLLTSGPQNTSNNELVTDVILERNTAVFGTTPSLAFRIIGSEHTVRNNVFILSANPNGGSAVEVTEYGTIAPTPNNNRIYNNSAFHASSAFTFLRIGSQAANTTVRNNLIHRGSGSGNPTMISGSGTNLQQSNNLSTATPGWISATPATASDFALAEGSIAINAGATIPVLDDFKHAVRPNNTVWDIGAFEFGPLEDVEPPTPAPLELELLSHGAFEPDQATVLQDMTNPYTIGTGPTQRWQGRVGAVGSQTTTYVDDGAGNHFLTVGASTNTFGAFQVITWPGAGTKILSYSYRGTSSRVRIYGGNTGNTINKFDGGNTLTFIQEFVNPASAAWTTLTHNVALTGSYSHLVVQIRAGDFDNVSLAIENSVPVILTETLPNGEADGSYSQTLTANGGNGTLTWSLASGTLPDGLSLAADGTLTGTPNTPGTATFTVKVADNDVLTGASDEATRTFTITINAEALPTIYTSWATGHGLTSEESDPILDLDSDGLANLAEFAFGSDPVTGNAETRTVSILTVNGQEYPSVSYIRRESMEPVFVRTAVSADLDPSADLGSVAVSNASRGDGTETVVIRSAVPLSTHPMQFFHLTVVLP